jgi:UDP-glucose:(heptosyl)LPS alpha-1,3-glucosyltransferase
MMDQPVVDFLVMQVIREFSLDGGAESVAFELRRAWQAIGQANSVLTSKSSQRAADIEALWPAILGRIPTTGLWRYLGRLVVVPVFTLFASLRLRRRPPGTVVLSHGDTLEGDVVVVHAVNQANLLHKRQDREMLWRINPMHAWVALRDRLMIGGLRFRLYVAPSHRVRDELMQLYRVPSERIVVIPNGVNLMRFRPDPADRAAMRQELGLPAEVPVLLFVGHEFDRKGLDPVLDAMAALGGNARLLVAGAGDVERYSRHARTLGVQDRVRFLGPRRDVERLYRAADVFVLPTRYETFSLVCMEAMACGTPVLACAVGGIEDYLMDGVNGWAIPRDGAAIAARLAPMLADPSLMARLRAGALATAARYGWPIIARRYQQVLGSVARQRGATALPERQPTPDGALVGRS